MKIEEQTAERHVLNVIVDNEAGILAKISGMFTARGYNIDSLTVADISEDHAISRITVVTRGPEPVIDQIRGIVRGNIKDTIDGLVAAAKAHVREIETCAVNRVV